VPAFTPRVDEPPAVTELGLSDAVDPEGCPLRDRATVWADPEVTAVEIVLVPEPLWARLRLDGLAEIEKSLVTGAVTVREIVVECVALEPVPVMVRV
jgi:hypothetical protein